ncbi:SDR family oxidoreductase [Paraglaciecola polaris]|uniref:Short chain dehydrogenase n=1 Tax=Paraglaciecola polaris LMG 21857 TaxID=1129793 RepID=K7AJE7_9ALTE|nr:SDR family oxidoreductase [Paraglaciecola polaris]GAC35335.1 short chain dehydrogenase [Paraglaciecola polaris LMG 21857]|tara:strand:+ start:5450 stop:6184 length:735 start_codon:yes stop_codon:yes gene_type:complete
MTDSIQGKVALVTGANRGIGKAIVNSLIENGATKVYLAVRNPESTKEIEAQYGDKVVTLAADVADTASIQRLATQASDVDILVNNAGIMHVTSPLGENAEESLMEQININVFGLMRVANAFAETLERNKGVLVQLNSIASIKAFGDIATYCASKAAAYSITQGLKDKWADKGIRVLSVHPGPIGTEMGDSAGFEGAPDATVVSEAIITALNNGDFHSFPDPVAKQLEAAYQSYSDAIITSDLSL